jgi:hypothetical protein
LAGSVCVEGRVALGFCGDGLPDRVGTRGSALVGRAVWWQRHRVFGTAPSVVGTGSAVPS